MQLNIISVGYGLNPHYQKSQINENEYKAFTTYLNKYIENLKTYESQNEASLVSNALKPFLRSCGLSAQDKDKLKGNSEIDLSVYLDSIESKQDSKKSLQAIFEVKKWDNKTEMLSPTNINCKALHEAILYYFIARAKLERPRFIVITNFYEFYIIRARDFEALFFGNKHFKNLYDAFTKNSIFQGNNKKFYDEAKRILDSKAYLDSITENGKLQNLNAIFVSIDSDLKNSKQLYKIFNERFLCDTFNPNDANILNRRFYNELLYILGLVEHSAEDSQDGITTIIKSKESDQKQGTLYYNIESSLIDSNKPSDFESVISLIILWLNRILFLKLVETNLINFNKDYKLGFLNTNKIPDFQTFNELFFKCLAKDYTQREDLKSTFQYLPYLNSSLFQKNDIEKNLIDISNLKNDLILEYYHSTQVKDKNTKPKTGSVDFLEYLFTFLDSFDYGIEILSHDGLMPHSKELISSSVLGLIFEKLNGYKEGSFFTPAFITSFMCKEALESIVIDRFSDKFKFNAKDFANLKDALNDKLDNTADRLNLKKEFIKVLESIKICDPSVGSGHFLVAMLNEMIHIYYKLGLALNDAYLYVENDELIIIDKSTGKNFIYEKPQNDMMINKSQAQNLQKHIFHLKQNIIENNLFGVDINENSCEIARLRLWIELLKNSYYLESDTQKYHNLNTLPNIDINIKAGNSLISYFSLNQKLTFRNVESKIKEYKKLVQDYKDGFYTDKYDLDVKIHELYETFKASCFMLNFEKEIKAFDKKCNEYSNKYSNFLAKDDKDLRVYVTQRMFQPEFDENEAKKEFKILKQEYDKLYNLESNKPIEWRFCFPEVLSDNGDFQGFDIIISNPPYIRQERIKHLKDSLSKYKIYNSTADIYTYFYELGFNLLKNNGIFSMITSNKFCRAAYGNNLRSFLLDNTQILSYTELNGIRVFEVASVDVGILSYKKLNNKTQDTFKYRQPKDIKDLNEKLKDKETKLKLNLSEYLDTKILEINTLSSKAFIFLDSNIHTLKAKIESRGIPLKQWDISIYRGVLTGCNRAFIINTQTRDSILKKCSQKADSIINGKSEFERTKELIKPILRGRDIKRYSYKWAGVWLINTHNGYKIDSKTKIPPINIDEYPALKAHLDRFYPKISKRTDKGITPYNLRNCAYLQDFEKQKIVWAEMTNEPRFTWDKSGIFINQTCYFIPNASLYMLALLNSKLMYFYMRHIASSLGGGAFRWIKQFIEKLPIINNIDSKTLQKIESLTIKIIESKNTDSKTNTKHLESKLDSIIYQLYALTPDEIKLIESNH